MNMIERQDLALIRANIKTAEDALRIAMIQLERLEKSIKGESPVPKPALTLVAAAPKPAPEPPKVEEPLTFTEEWKQTLDLLNNGTGHVFVTGGAGTGKSTLLNQFIPQYHGNAAVLAPTGVAALRVLGETIHRFFGFPAHALEATDIKHVSDSRKAKFETLDMLIVDEISMVRADLMDAVDQFLRKNGRDKGKPFGGCRIVMFGDPYQLPPVAREKQERQWLMGRYGTEEPYFFHAECWRDNPIKTCQLTTIFRQKDAAFTDVLNAIRNGAVTSDQLSLINSRVQSGFRPDSTDDLWMTLTTTNNAADQANQRMLNQLPGSPEIFEAFVTGDFDEKNYPTDEQLRLKVGAVVMFIRNSGDKDNGWVNGSMGKVTSLKPLTVLVNGEERKVEPVAWQNMTYDFDEETKKLTKTEKGEFTQIPLKLAAAVTIHKSQGITLDRVVIDFANGTFAAGQAYVALSRCTTLQGMILRRALQERDLITSTEVQKFMRGEPIARPAQIGQLNLPLTVQP